MQNPKINAWESIRTPPVCGIDLFYKLLTMKKSLIHSAIILLGLMTSTGCTKEQLDALDNINIDDVYTWNYGGGAPKDLKIKVLEYGSQLELRNAELMSKSQHTAANPTGEVLGDWHTDSAGEIYLKSFERPDWQGRYFEFSKENYWTNGGTTLDSTSTYPIVTDYFQITQIYNLASVDSMVVTLFPVAWISLKIRNSNIATDSATATLLVTINQDLSLNGLSTPPMNIPIELPKSNHTDTVLIKTRGNVENRMVITIQRPGLDPIVAQHDEVIAKNGTSYWELDY
jgi:hypothetical protein